MAEDTKDKIEPISLIGKTVSIKNKGLLNVFYPDFVIKDKLFFDQDNSIIYVGPIRKDLISYLDNGTKAFINTAGQYDLDLDNREVLAKFVYSRWGKEVKTEIQEYLNNLDETDFFNYIKAYWVVGKSKIEKAEVTIFDLYKTVGKSRKEALTVLLNLLDVYNVSMIESSLLTFIEKAVTYKDVSASPHYLRMLKEFDERCHSKLSGLLDAYRQMQDTKEMKLMWLVMNL